MSERDICDRRHRGAETSEHAHRKVVGKSERMRAWIHARIVESSTQGMTLEDVLDRINALIAAGRAESGRTEPMSDNDISGRISELKAAGLIVVSPWDRARPNRAGNSCRVYVDAALVFKGGLT